MAATIVSPSLPARPRRRPTAVLVAAATLAVLLLAVALTRGRTAIGAVVLVDAGLLAFATHRFFLRWHMLVVAIVLCILLVPIGRYELPISLPFNLEPYRLLVAAVVLVWIASLLAQPDTRWRRTGLFVPIFAVSMSVIVSVGVNTGRLSLPGVQEAVNKQVSMFASFIAVMVFVSCVIRTRDELHTVLKALVGGGAVVSLFAMVQYRAGFNIFDHLDKGVPVLRLVPGGIPDHIEARGGGERVYASAPHPIALSAALVMLIPLGLYLAKAFPGRRWALATALIAITTLATVARTGSVMLLVVLLTFLCIKPRPVLKLWPYLLPFLLVVHFAAPEALGGLKSAFFPKQGLIAEQHESAGQIGSNRLADLGPSLQEWSKKPWFGQGFGTRISAPSDPNVNAPILDDQWLVTLLETGAVGFLSLLALFVSAIRRAGAAARREPSAYGWLLAGLAASIASFAVGMITFDAFSFFQCTFIVFALMGLSIAARRLMSEEPTAELR